MKKHKYLLNLPDYLQNHDLRKVLMSELEVIDQKVLNLSEQR